MKPDYFVRVNDLLAPYGPDGYHSFSEGSVKIVYCAFHTNKESCQETQPHQHRTGVVLTWDGRLDNRGELMHELSDTVAGGSCDAQIVAAAYARWGTDSFAKLVGDWALSLWNPTERSLILAKDPIGTRHLHYSLDHTSITWSTVLDPLVLLAERAFTVNEEYIAGWLSFFPAPHLTPYTGISSVPPSCFIQVTPGKLQVRKYWDFDPGNVICHHNDAEYEDRFREIFAEAVRRRLRGAPALVRSVARFSVARELSVCARFCARSSASETQE